MDRFYTLFNSVYKYYDDFRQFLRELMSGFYISHTINSVMIDTDGRQLMCEALYLWGTMLLLLDELIPGPARERLVVAFFRCKGEGAIQNVDEVRRLVKATGFVRGGKKPENYPNELFTRFPIDPRVISMIIDQIRSEDMCVGRVGGWRVGVAWVVADCGRTALCPALRCTAATHIFGYGFVGTHVCVWNARDVYAFVCVWWLVCIAYGIGGGGGGNSYRQKTVYPSPAHRSAVYAQQASMAFVILLFAPKLLHSNRSLMREVVSKHFNDNWIVPLYMGRVVDLTVEWAPYPAAIGALELETLSGEAIAALIRRHQTSFQHCARDLRQLLTEGVLTEQCVPHA